jgi:hypothetical protein
VHLSSQCTLTHNTVNTTNKNITTRCHHISPTSPQNDFLKPKSSFVASDLSFQSSNSPQLSIQRFLHPFDVNISDSDLLFITQTHAKAFTIPFKPITNTQGHLIPLVSHKSFCDLLTHGSPVNDFILHGFLSVICSSQQNVQFVDTTFSRFLYSHGWENVFRLFFLHQNSSSYAKCLNRKPCADIPSILFPIPIQESHWVAVICRIINNRVHLYLFFLDDMNNANTEETIKSYFTSTTDNSTLFPSDASWITCRSFTYLPHLNECGLCTLMALTILALHPFPPRTTLLPCMHPNIAQFSCWWIAKTLVTQTFDIEPVVSLFDAALPSPLSEWHIQSHPFGIAPLSYEHCIPSRPPSSSLQSFASDVDPKPSRDHETRRYFQKA